ncbi:hypothetical protein IPL44_03830 [Candidatus Saccharibacteria bacterium]|nr:MAG: hypothetical protein IPL44_03830 [Candidatus Saccharibacteria bacterium]
MAKFAHKSSKKSVNKLARRFKPSKQAVKQAVIWAVVIAVIFGVLELGRRAGYWGEPDALRAIKAEKIASKDLLGLELISQDETGKKSLFMIEGTSPSVERTFKPKDGDVEVTLYEIIKYAESEGWKHDNSLSYAWVARKYFREIELVMSVEDSEDHIIVRVSAYESR